MTPPLPKFNEACFSRGWYSFDPRYNKIDDNGCMTGPPLREDDYKPVEKIKLNPNEPVTAESFSSAVQATKALFEKQETKLDDLKGYIHNLIGTTPLPSLDELGNALSGQRPWPSQSLIGKFQGELAALKKNNPRGSLEAQQRIEAKIKIALKRVEDFKRDIEIVKANIDLIKLRIAYLETVKAEGERGRGILAKNPTPLPREVVVINPKQDLHKVEQALKSATREARRSNNLYHKAYARWEAKQGELAKAREDLKSDPQNVGIKARVVSLRRELRKLNPFELDKKRDEALLRVARLEYQLPAGAVKKLKEVEGRLVNYREMLRKAKQGNGKGDRLKTVQVASLQRDLQGKIRILELNQVRLSQVAQPKAERGTEGNSIPQVAVASIVIQDSDRLLVNLKSPVEKLGENYQTAKSRYEKAQAVFEKYLNEFNSAREVSPDAFERSRAELHSAEAAFKKAYDLIPEGVRDQFASPFHEVQRFEEKEIYKDAVAFATRLTKSANESKGLYKEYIALRKTVGEQLFRYKRYQDKMDEIKGVNPTIERSSAYQRLSEWCKGGKLILDGASKIATEEIRTKTLEELTKLYPYLKVYSKKEEIKSSGIYSGNDSSQHWRADWYVLRDLEDTQKTDINLRRAIAPRDAVKVLQDQFKKIPNSVQIGLIILSQSPSQLPRLTIPEESAALKKDRLFFEHFVVKYSKS